MSTYFLRLNNDKSKGGIQYTIDTVLDELERNPSRRYNQVEIAYFWRWWREASQRDQLRMRKMISQRRFSFLLGGWCMNDEAVTTYKAMIEQNGLGLKWLRDEFGCAARPHAAWQIDTFGHTRGQAEVFANMGYDSVFFARLDREELAQRNEQMKSEVMWKGNLNRNDTDMFTGNFINGQYSCPDGFCFGPFQPNDDAIVDNNKSDAYNVDEYIAKALNTSVMYNNTYLTDHVMWTMGKDNAYAFARLWYKNMDKLIDIMNEKAGDKVNFLYSTPECYTLAKNSVKIDWPVNEADYMPLRTGQRWWTGFYTSRSNYKAYVRETYAILASAHQLLYHKMAFGEKEEFNLARAYAIGQHHDGITGTHAQFVQQDYLHQFSKARNDWFNASQVILHEHWGAPMTAIQCDELNSTICSVSETVPSFSFGFYNPAGWTYNHPFRIPLSNPNSFVLEGSFDLVSWDVIPLSQTRKLVNADRSNATHELLIYPQLKQFDFYAANFTTIDNTPAEKTTMTIDIEYGEMTNNYWTVDFNKTTPGAFLLTSADLNHTMKIDVLWYNSTIDGEYGSDDAYNFYPYGGAHFLTHVSTEQTVGTTFQQMELLYSDQGMNVSLVMRLYSPDQGLPIGYNALLEKEIEIEWTVLGYDIPDKSGKNVVVRYSTDIDNMILTDHPSEPQSNHTLLKTDSSGRFWIDRVTDFRPNIANFTQTDPIAGNYYPLVNRARIENQRANQSVTVYVDRSHGCASLSTGQIEIMIQRRINNTDDLAHDISEAGIQTTGKQVLMFGQMASVEEAYHEDKLTYKPSPYFWPNQFQQKNRPGYGKQMLWKDETAPYRVVSVQRDGQHQILVCLEHLEEGGNNVIDVDFVQLLKTSHVKNVEEFYLGKICNI